jgi:hypothetical protein
MILVIYKNDVHPFVGDHPIWLKTVCEQPPNTYQIVLSDDPHERRVDRNERR